MLISNNTKAVMTALDFEAVAIVNRRDCYVIQNYKYVSSHPRDEQGKPYGTTNCALMDVVINIDSFHTVQTFYQQLRKNEPYTYSIFFDVVYDSQNNIDSYAQAIKMEGFVVDIEENFNTETPEDKKRKQMFFKVRLLLTKVKYICGNNSVIQQISK